VTYRRHLTTAQKIMHARRQIETIRAAEAANLPPVDYRTPQEKARDTAHIRTEVKS
jgi:hypothetical protein